MAGRQWPGGMRRDLTRPPARARGPSSAMSQCSLSKRARGASAPSRDVGSHLPAGRRNAMIAKDFLTAKDFHTYTTIVVRQEKDLRDHGTMALKCR
jgi:hypothetical protein